ncbi:hypothetical protein HAX54_037002, partial [Datura stramonium]|nr:hypothetical protein [Datura stramonium]
ASSPRHQWEYYVLTGQRVARSGAVKTQRFMHLSAVQANCIVPFKAWEDPPHCGPHCDASAFTSRLAMCYLAYAEHHS